MKSSDVDILIIPGWSGSGPEHWQSRWEARLTTAAELILPGLPLDVVAFGCTSASMVIGEDKVFARIREVRPGIACTTPITAARTKRKPAGMTIRALCKRRSAFTVRVGTGAVLEEKWRNQALAKLEPRR